MSTRPFNGKKYSSEQRIQQVISALSTGPKTCKELAKIMKCSKVLALLYAKQTPGAEMSWEIRKHYYGSSKLMVFTLTEE